jgi:hypothetical protein
MPRFHPILPFLLSSLLLAGAPSAGGLRLGERLDAMDVEHHWLAGARVDWRTGDPVPGRPGKTHCSAFAAEACERLGVYLLRPPEHAQVRLATAQAEWLQAHGAERGWVPVGSPAKAQDLANDGELVVALYPSPDPGKSGHVAVVRPWDKSEDLLEEEGPQVTQAGAENAASICLKQGFRHHRGAWISARDNRILFFAHDLPR